MMSESAACAVAPIVEKVSNGPSLQFSLPTIHCAACIGKIERGLQSLQGVASARVNLSLKRLSVEGPVTKEQVLSKLTGLGFEAHLLDMEVLSEMQDKIGRALLLRMAVAGFAMMNVMLLSVAVWSGATDATRDFFHLVSACIAIPVVAYAGHPFFDNALTALRVGRLNMDVPISLAIILATGMSFFETINGGEHAYFDAAISLTFFILIGRYLDHRTRNAARSAAKELAALEAPSAERIDDAGTSTVEVSDLLIGDTIIVPTGARVPVDGDLLSLIGLTDRSFLTGESTVIEIKENDIVLAGEINLGSAFKMRATAVGEDTTLRSMAAMVETAEASRNSYTALADRAAQIYAPAVHLLSVVAFFAWWLGTGDPRLALNIAIAVLIITCPCALGLAVPAVSTAAIGCLFSKGYLVKHATALDRLAEVTHIVLDKTGTITRSVSLDLSQLPNSTKSIIKALSQSSLHPKSRALCGALLGVKATQYSELREVAGDGIYGKVAGETVRLGRGAWLKADFEGLGIRIGREEPIPLEIGEEIRQGTEKVLAELNLPCEILTGDNKGPAQIIAQKLGLKVTYNVGPKTKVGHLDHLLEMGAKVLMVGDGLNDTAALVTAHASIAPASALEAARSASDVVALTEKFVDLPFIIAIAKKARKLSKQNFAIAAAYNSVAVPLALLGHATPLLAALAMSFSSMTVLINSQRMRW